MKIRGVDYGIKHIRIECGGRTYNVAWKYDILRGVRVTDISGFGKGAVVTWAFPPLPGVMGEMLMHCKSRCLRRIGVHVSDRFRYVHDQPRSN